MTYETSVFSYPSDSAQSLDNMTMFHDVSCEDFDSAYNTYFSLINNGNIDDAVNYINSSTMHTYNASLFNRLSSMINKTQQYYVDNYWDATDSEWAEKSHLHAYNETGSVGNSAVWICPSDADVTLNRGQLLRRDMWISGEYTGWFYGEWFNSTPTGGGEFPTVSDKDTVNSFLYDDIVRLNRGKYSIDVGRTDDSIFISATVYSNAVYDGVWEAFGDNSKVDRGYSDYPSVEPIYSAHFYADEAGVIDLTNITVEDGVVDTDTFWLTLSINVESSKTLTRDAFLNLCKPSDIFVTVTQI